MALHALIFNDPEVSSAADKRGCHPGFWFWKEGKLTNEKDGEREFLYLHFMRWQTNRWINTPHSRVKAHGLDEI